MGSGDVEALARRLRSELTGSGPQNLRVRLLLQVLTLALTQPSPCGASAKAAVDDWVGPVPAALQHRSGFPLTAARGRATVLVSGLRGLAMDRYISGEVARIDGAAALLVHAAVDDRS